MDITTTSSSPSASLDKQSEAEPSLITWARHMVAHDMGLKDESILAEEFTFIGPFDGQALLPLAGLNEAALLSNDKRLCGVPPLAGGHRPIGKRQFLDGSRSFNLRGAFPDFQFNAHDFLVDKVQPRRVWFVTRKSGTHTGDLPMYDKVIAPTGRCLDFPPESYSFQFNEEGKCVKMTGGFVMDAQQGKSGGLGGPLGIAKCVGYPRSRLSYEPPLKAITNLIMGPLRMFQGKGGADIYVPPSVGSFGEGELVEAAKQIFLKYDGGLQCPERLSKDFAFFDPLIGTALDKETYLEKYHMFNVKGAFPDLTVDAYNWRVDPHAPCTVWCTVRYAGTHKGCPLGSGPLAISPTGCRYESAPEAVSLTFNPDKLCCRMTVGAVMDREEGNTGGLGGIHGIRYALGHPTLPLLTRPLRFQSTAEWSQAVKGIGADILDKLWNTKGTPPSPANAPQGGTGKEGQTSPTKAKKVEAKDEEATLWDLVHDPLVVATE